jgi:hypothetical protein
MKHGITFDRTFIECATQNNGGRPSINSFDTDKAKERTIKSLLSFNENDAENIFKNNEILEKEATNVVAFAIDNFGNYICFSKENGTVIFYDFESGQTEHIADSFSEFLGKLY